MKTYIKAFLIALPITALIIGAFLGIVRIAEGSSVLFPYQGGTGTSTVPLAGNILIGNSNGNGSYVFIASSSLVGGGGSISTSSQLVAGQWVIASAYNTVYSTSSEPVLIVNQSGTLMYISSISATGAITLGIPSNVGAFSNDKGYIATSTWVINASGTNIFTLNSNGSSTIWVNSNPTFNNLTYTNASGTNESVTGYLESQNIYDNLGNKYVTSTGSSGGVGTSTLGAYTPGNLAFFTNSSTISATSALSIVSSTAQLSLLGNMNIGTTTLNGLFSVVNASNTAVFTISSTTNVSSSNVVFNVVATSSIFQILGSGHLNATGTIPTLSSCGTSPTIVGSDWMGQATVGTVSATGCIVNFQIPYEKVPACMVGSETGLATAIGWSETTAALTITDGVGSVVGDKLDYQCWLPGL